MGRDDRSVLGWGAFVVAIAALSLALFAMRDDGDASAATNGGGAAAAATDGVQRVNVELSDFRIEPAMLAVKPGKTIVVITNSGSMVHNFAVPDLGIVSPDIQPGGSFELDLGELEEGDYDTACLIAGHAGSGMTGMLMVNADGAATHDGTTHGGDTTEMTWQEMDAMMDEVAKSFPAETKGKGGERLEPTVTADGTKEFEVTASIVDWEVAPGQIVKAWTYNGVVPAPEIHVEVGDKVRLIVHNELPESTAVHFHGIVVPNSMDGVDPYTQPAITPGETYTYEFTAKEPAVGIYHSHHNAQVQVPNGMFGAFTIGEMPIPEFLQEQGYTKVDKRVNMVVNDAGTIGLSLNGKSFPATEAYTLKVGEVMEVNYLNEGMMAHPMHLHQPVGWVTAKDGVPLPSPIPSDTINVAPGERYTVLYKAVEPGVWAWHCHILTHAESSEGMFGMVTALIVEE
jgi:FtsP/CotA-like multicopper oxidase with cupredoxin domain